MRILKIFGIVVGIHVMAVTLISANPGCSTQTRSTPVPSDTVVKSPGGGLAQRRGHGGDARGASAGDGDAPAIRFNPTRPNTPVASALVASPVEDVTPAKTYTVGNGDNLWTLSKSTMCRWETSRRPITSRRPPCCIPAEKLIIPGNRRRRKPRR
jgi:hypothetical protein